MSKNSIVKTTMWVTIVMCLGYIVSFAKETVVANYFGVSMEVDAYTIALQVPVILFSFVAVAIQSVIVPLYSELLYNKGRKESDSFASNLTITVLLFAGIFFIVGEIFAGGIIYVFAPGFGQEAHDLATELLRITLPTIFFSLITQVFTAVLNVHKKFILPSASVLILNIGLIISIIFLHSRYGIVSACVGQIIGCLCQTIFLFSLIKKYFTLTFILDLKDVTLRQAIRMSIPVFWSISVSEINAIVNKIMASFLFVGSIAAMGYAQKINTIFISFFTSSIATIVYPMYAESAVKGDIKQLNNRINITLSAYSFFLIPAMLFVLCYRKEIIEIAFARGAFGASAIDITQQLLGFYVFGILFMALRSTITNVFYSLRDSKTPAKNATIGVAINIVLNLSLPFIMGVNGLALATSITAMYITTSLLYSLLKRYDGLDLKMFYANLRGIAAAAIISFVLMACVKFFIRDISNILSLLIGFGVCSVIYLIVVYFSKIPVVIMMRNMITIKKKR